MARETTKTKTVAAILKAKRGPLLESWLVNIRSLPGNRTLEFMSEEQLRAQAGELLRTLTIAFGAEQYEDIRTPEFADSVTMLREISASRAKQGFTASETCTFVLSLKDALMEHLQDEFSDNPELLNAGTLKMNKVVDKLALVTFETYAQTREDVIAQQRQEIIDQQKRSLMELSTPVIQVWDEVVLLPLVGVIDTQRAQQIIERLLHAIVETQARAAILDVTGVPVVDARVAQHLTKTVSSARMLGAEVFVTGVSPEAAQTLIELDVDLSAMRTCGTLRSGVKAALAMVGLAVGTA